MFQTQRSKLFNRCRCMYTHMMRLLLITFLGSYSVQAQISNPTKWSFNLLPTSIYVGDTIEISAKATIEPNWYLYSNDFDPALGPTVTTFSFEPNQGYRLIGSILPINPKKKFDAVWSGDITYFVDHAEFRQKVVILSPNPVIAVSIEYQTCNDVLGRCIPGEEEFVFNNISVQPVKAGSSSPKKTAVQVPMQSSGVKSTLKELEAEKEKLIETDPNGSDVTIDYLKSFVKKYGK